MYLLSTDDRFVYVCLYGCFFDLWVKSIAFPLTSMVVRVYCLTYDGEIDVSADFYSSIWVNLRRFRYFALSLGTQSKGI